MDDRGAGTVTFVFTDIEGSTRKWQDHGEAMRAALERHDATLADALQQHGGHVFKHTGDGVCAVFASCTAAISAAVDVQRRITSETWESVDGLAVRIGIHTGEAEERDGDYFGTTLNRTARVMAAAHGGQILLSGTSAELVRGDTPPGTSIVDLGMHTLRDLVGAEHLHQVVAEGLRDDFPAPRTASTERRIPVPRTSFVGRDDEVAQVVATLGESRLVTLVGIGGTGKTRLALEVARRVGPQFEGRTFFVDLSPLTDPALIAAAVATELGLPSGPGVGSALDAVVAMLAGRHALVVLDNCEHLVDACADLVDLLLDRCPHVVVLATSRESLGIDGERVWPVPSLDSTEAHQLFVERAAAVDPRFSMTADDEISVAEICRRLDGIPLAIELAAARVGHLGVADIAGRLDDRFRLLTGGRRRRAQRQQTLQAAIDWSHDTLGDDERSLLRRVTVFAGGFTLAAVDGVCGPTEGGTIVDVLGRLVDKSLVVAEPTMTGTRYRLLETIRIYAAEKLVEGGEATSYRSKHRDWFLQRLEAEPIDDLACDYDVVGRHMAELENYRVAIDWSEAEERTDLALRIAVGLTGVWALGGHHDEGASLLRALADDDGLDDALRARCLAALSYASMTIGDFETMTTVADASVQLDADGPLAALALVYAALYRVFDPARYEEAHALFERARAVALRHGQDGFIAMADAIEAHFLVLEGRYDEVLELRGSTPPRATFAEVNLRYAVLASGVLTGTRAVATSADLVPPSAVGTYTHALRAIAELEFGDRSSAVAILVAGTRLYLDQPFPLMIGDLLVAFAALALHDGDATRAATLLETVIGQAGLASFRSPSTFAIWRWLRRRARDALGRPAFDAARLQAASTDARHAFEDEVARLDAAANASPSPASSAP